MWDIICGTSYMLHHMWIISDYKWNVYSISMFRPIDLYSKYIETCFKWGRGDLIQNYLSQKLAEHHTRWWRNKYFLFMLLWSKTRTVLLQQYGFGWYAKRHMSAPPLCRPRTCGIVANNILRSPRQCWTTRQTWCTHGHLFTSVDISPVVFVCFLLLLCFCAHAAIDSSQFARWIYFLT